MRRAIALLMAAALLLCGCSALRENNDTSDLPELSPSAAAGTGAPIVIRPALYFADERTGKLAAEVREIIVPEGMSEAEVIVGALLNGPQSDGLSFFAMGLGVRRVELSDELANVYITATHSLQELEKFTLAAAVANTMADFYQTPYSSVFFNDEVLTVGGVPCGPLNKSDGEIRTLYSEFRAKYPGENESAELDAALYFLAPSKEYMLCEVRRVSVPDGDYIRALLEELIAGPASKYYLVPCLSGSARVSSGVDFDKETGVLTLDLGRGAFAEGDRAYTVLECATVYYTLAGLIPGIKRLVVETGTDTIITTRYSSQIYPGARVTLYFPDSSLTSLSAAERTIPAGELRNVSARLTELIKGPSSIDPPTVWPAFPEGISERDLLSLTMDGTTAMVDMSENFAKKMGELSSESLTLAIYAIINTLAVDTRVRRVQFLIQGQRVHSIGGSIDLYEPLMPNPGLVR